MLVLKAHATTIQTSVDFFIADYSVVFFLLIICVYLYGHAYMCVTVCRSDEPFGSWFSFHYVGPRDQTQIIRIEGKHLYMPSHLASPSVGFLERCMHVCVCVC